MQRSHDWLLIQKCWETTIFLRLHEWCLVYSLTGQYKALCIFYITSCEDKWCATKAITALNITAFLLNVACMRRELPLLSFSFNTSLIYGRDHSKPAGKRENRNKRTAVVGAMKHWPREQVSKWLVTLDTLITICGFPGLSPIAIKLGLSPPRSSMLLVSFKQLRWRQSVWWDLCRWCRTRSQGVMI